MAEQLFISMDTSKTHIKNVYAKFGVHSRYELMAEFLRLTGSLGNQARQRNKR